MSKVLDLVLAGTPPQFDESGKLATTEFVQRALGNNAETIMVAGNLTLTPGDAGKSFIHGETTPITITLPLILDTPFGAAFEFMNTGTADLTVQRAGADQIDNGPTAANSVVIPPNQSLRLVRAQGSSLWHPVGITAQALGSTLAAILGDTGYQRLPSGLIVQWGLVSVTAANANQTFALSVPFPTAFYGAVATHHANAAPAASPSISTGRSGLGSIILRASAISQVFYVALGS